MDEDNLDIRIIEGNFRKYAGLNIYIRCGKGLARLEIEKGNLIWKESCRRVLPNIRFRTPYFSSKEMRFINQLERKRKIPKVKLPETFFSQIANGFVTNYALGRQEREIITIEDYLRTKQDLPMGTSDFSMNEVEKFQKQKEIMENIYLHLLTSPQDFGFPHCGIYQEVRLDNRLSKCAVNEKMYQDILKGDVGLPLTICDFVLLNSQGIYIVEAKTFFGDKVPWVLNKSQHQLGKAYLFLKHNFGIKPHLATLEYMMKTKHTYVTHYSFNRGNFQVTNRVKI